MCKNAVCEIGEETSIVKTVVGMWDEGDFGTEDSWPGLCMAYRRICRVRYQKSQPVVHCDSNGLIRSLEEMP